MANMLATQIEAADQPGLASLVAELCANGWADVVLDTTPVIDAATGVVTSGEARTTVAVVPSSAGTTLDAALEAMTDGAWDTALALAEQSLGDPATLAPALYIEALCHAAAGRAVPLAEAADFLDSAGTSHPGPTALAGYAAFLAGDDARGRKLMARAARKGRRAQQYTRTLKFVQKTLLEQHFGM